MESELQRERAALLKADHDIAEGEDRIQRQRETILHLQEIGQDIRQAEQLEELLVDTLEGWRQHRVLIVERIAYLEARPPRRNLDEPSS